MASNASDGPAMSGRLQLFGIVLVVLGILALLCPLVTGVAIAYMVGGLVLVAGFTRIVGGFGATSFGEGVWAFVAGLVMVVGGVLMILHPLLNLKFLTLLVAAYFIVVGLVTAIGAFRMKPAAGWGMVLFNGVVSLLLGGLIWAQWPLSGAWALGVLLGVQLLLTGIQMITVASAMRGVRERLANA